MGIGIAIPTNATTNNKIVFDANEKQEFHDDNHLDNPDNNANDLLTVMMTMMMSHAIEEVKSSMAHDKAVVQLAMEWQAQQNDKHNRNSILEPRVRHLHMYVCVYVC